METRNARIGLVLFAFYLLLYGGFVVLNAFSPETMEATPLAGVNLAVWFGFALIAAAMIEALIYGWLCSRPADDEPSGEPPAGGKG